VAGVYFADHGGVRSKRVGTIHYAFHRGELCHADRNHIHLRSTQQAIQDNEEKAGKL